VKERILIVEDDPGMASMTKILLTERGYKVQAVDTAEAGLEKIRLQPPDLIITDLQLPGLSGSKFCEILKDQPATSAIPLIMLTVLGKAEEKVRGLRTGADDYLTKPFDAEELVARVEALLRRTNQGSVPSDVYQLRDLVVNFNRREVMIRGQLIDLPRKEYEILALLIKKKGQALNRNYIVEYLWKDEVVVTSNTLNTHIKNLRKKLGPYRDIVLTVFGDGYKLNENI